MKKKFCGCCRKDDFGNACLCSCHTLYDQSEDVKEKSPDDTPTSKSYGELLDEIYGGRKDDKPASKSHLNIGESDFCDLCGKEVKKGYSDNDLFVCQQCKIEHYDKKVN